MNRYPGAILVTAAAIALAMAACGDDPPTGGDDLDDTPPTVVAVVPVDEYHVDVTFSEDVTQGSAEQADHYQIIESGAPAAASDPGDRLYVTAAVLGPDKRTVALGTHVSMAGLELTLSVTGVSDAHQNTTPKRERVFVGSDLPDIDPPQLVRSTPASGATGVPIGTAVTIYFSEAIDATRLEDKVVWSTPAGPVRFRRGDYDSGSRVTLVSFEFLEYNTLQTISLSGLKDRSGNVLADASFSFTTTDVADDSRPRLVASSPRNGAVHVSVNTQVTLTFSEPMNRYNYDLAFTPDIVFGGWSWSDDNRTLTMTLRDWDPLNDGRQYSITVFPGGFFDLGGNTLKEYQTVTFSTGGELEEASIEGRIAGDPGTGAEDPTGGVVIAESWFTFGVAMVAADDRYEIVHLESAPYYLRAYRDTNNDGVISVYGGDALGGFGVDFAAGDFELEVVPVGKSDHVRTDISIHDPAAASGVVSYVGEPIDKRRPIRVGLFRTIADASNLTNPLASSRGEWPYSAEWLFNQFFHEFAEGDYYIGAYIDADSSGSYEPGADPAGVYGGFASPIRLHMVDGADYFDVVVIVAFEAPTAASPSRVTWPAPRMNIGFGRLADAVQRRIATPTKPVRDAGASSGERP